MKISRQIIMVLALLSAVAVASAQNTTITSSAYIFTGKTTFSNNATFSTNVTFMTNINLSGAALTNVTVSGDISNCTNFPAILAIGGVSATGSFTRVGDVWTLNFPNSIWTSNATGIIYSCPSNSPSVSITASNGSPANGILFQVQGTNTGTNVFCVTRDG